MLFNQQFKYDFLKNLEKICSGFFVEFVLPVRLLKCPFGWLVVRSPCFVLLRPLALLAPARLVHLTYYVRPFECHLPVRLSLCPFDLLEMPV